MPSPIDYAAVGLRVGLEVHQQLATDGKLFCRCPAGRYTRTHDATVLRHMRPTLSELGVYDGTALMEFKTRKNIVYLLHRENVCTYEMDDTPPFLLDQGALDIAIEQCLMLGCDIVDEVHIARKQYLDGSIPTGFQRTAIVGLNGRLPFGDDREISILQVSIEEDSCREVADHGHLIVWRTDRLGMPLIETVTGPDLRTPEEAAEAILLIGRVCRSTGHVRVGIGASRQDVNVSVRGGRRVEIKGVAQAWRVPALVHGEAVRQVELLRLRDDLLRGGLSRAQDLAVSHRDVTPLFDGSSLPFLRREGWERWLGEEERRAGLARGEGPFCVRALRLEGLRRTLRWPTQPGLTFADELAGRVRVIATLDQAPFLLHRDDWPAAAAEELRHLEAALGCAPDDGLVVVWGALEDTLTAAEEVRLRYADALDGVPHETRQPLDGGRTTFERILPGPDRMYPDTDSPPQELTRQRVETLRRSLPPPPWMREERYRRAGVPRATIHYLLRRGGAALVDLVAVSCGADLRRACYFFGEELKALRRAGTPLEGIEPARWCELFRLVAERPVLWEARRRIVERMAARPDARVAALVLEEDLAGESDGWETWLAAAARHAADTWRGPEGGGRRFHRHLMGEAMARLRGRVPAANVLQSVATLMRQDPLG